MNKRTWVFIAILVGFIGGGLAYRHFAQDVDSRGATRLMRAIEENDTDKTVKLLGSADVNVRDKSGQTALFYAAKYATEPKVIYKLIVAGADPMAVDKSGDTPLVVAAKYNPSTEVVLALVKRSHRALQQQENKDKALMKAAQHNTAEVIKALLIAQASPAALGPSGKKAVSFLDENEKLTEQEKADYRQVMLILEILEERGKFATSLKTAPAKPFNAGAEKAKQEVNKKEKSQTAVSAEKPTADVETELTTTPKPASSVQAKPAVTEKPNENLQEPMAQEKQMNAETN